MGLAVPVMASSGVKGQMAGAWPKFAKWVRHIQMDEWLSQNSLKCLRQILIVIHAQMRSKPQQTGDNTRKTNIFWLCKA
jgi:hypothetical protein